jgi:SPP1 family phage portal protein
MSIEKINRYPDYSAELEEIEKNGITTALINRIIERHQMNALHTRHLWGRYNGFASDVPISTRTPRFETKNGKEINNKLANDFFSEIVDIETGYFAGKPITYTYSNTEESEDVTGTEKAVDEASKALNDFVTRNNMYDLDMLTTKYTSAAEYCGRLFYIDEEGNERVKVLPPYETIVLFKNEMTEPSYGIRYYTFHDLNDQEIIKAEFYDNAYKINYQGFVGSLEQIGEPEPHLFDYCPLQGIPNNPEMLGSPEKVISLIDSYDKILSDSANEIESFANAYMVFENVNIKDEEITEAQATGAIRFFNGTGNGKVYFLTKDLNDAYIENKLNRLENNIYRFSKTPNFADTQYNNGSGVSLKFKLTGLETKCAMFEAKMHSAATYMFKVLGSSFKKKKIPFDYLQAYITCKRNFPADLANEATTAATLLGTGLPKKIVWENLSCVDDVDYALDLVEKEKDGIPDLDENIPEDNKDDKIDKIDLKS